MKISNVVLDSKLENLSGETLTEGKTDMTVVHACSSALLSADKEGDTGETKYERWVLVKKIKDRDNDLDLTSEELSLIKKCVGIVYPSIVVGQVYDALEGISD